MVIISFFFLILKSFFIKYVSLPILTRSVCKLNRIHFLSTGVSDSFIIESNGHYGLIDSSFPDENSIQVDKNVNTVINYLNQYKIKTLDFIIATHSHSDHIGGMPMIANSGFVTPNTVYYYRPYTGTSEDEAHPEWENSKYCQKAVNSMKAKKAKLIDVTDQKIKIHFNDFFIELFNTESKPIQPSENNNSIGALISHGTTKIFMASDIESTFSNKIASQIGKVDILKANHHGFSGLSFSYLKILQPKYVVVPNKEIGSHFSPVAAYLRSINCKIFCTGQKKDSIILKVNENGYEFENINVRESHEEHGNGFYKWENDWFYLDNGNFFKGWHKINWSQGTSWFYFDENGAMVTGWHQLDWSQGKSWFYFDENGAMMTGLHQLNWRKVKDWFYFNEHGAMQTGTIKIELDGIENVLVLDDKNGNLIKRYQEFLTT